MSFGWATYAAIASLLAVIAAGLISERRSGLRRRAIRRLYQFGERLISCRSIGESLHLLESELPALLGVTEASVYLQDRGSRALLRLEAAGAPGAGAVPRLTPERVRFREGSVELCFRSRSFMAVPDARRSPVFDPSQAAETPRSLALAPMFAREDLLGVLTVGHATRVRHFSEDESALLQHLANQVAISVKLLEQRSLQSRAHAAENLGAQFRLIAAAATDLHRTLASTTDLLQSAARAAPCLSEDSQARRLAGQAGLAMAVCASVLRFASLHREPQQTVDLAALLRGMLSRRESDWQERGLRVRSLLQPEPLLVAAPAGILEELLSSLLSHAESRLEAAGKNSLTVRAACLASTAQVDLSWPASSLELERPDSWGEAALPAEGVLGVDVCHALVETLGGRMSLARAGEEETRVEIGLPLAQPGLSDAATASLPPARPAAPLTALVLEPDTAARRELISALSELGHRAVPAAGVEEAAELSRLVRFHIIFCSSFIAGSTWMECLQATRDRIGTFVLLDKGHDPAPASGLPSGGGFVLPSPFRPNELARVLQQAAGREKSGGR